MSERPEACEDWQEAIAAFVTAQTAPDHEAALLAHVDGCATCRRELDSLTSLSATLLGADPTVDGEDDDQPADDRIPPDLGDRVVAAVAAERRRRRLGRLVAAVAACAVVVAIGVWAVRPAGNEALLAVHEAPLEGSDVVFVTAADGVTASAVVAGDASGSLVDLEASGLDPGETYALWLSPPGADWEDRVPAGTFRADESGRVDVRLTCSLPAQDVARVWATGAEGSLILDTE